MKTKVTIKLSVFEYREFVEGLRKNYSTLSAVSFHDVIVMETLEHFIIRSFEQMMSDKKAFSFTLNAVQAYVVYLIITDNTNVFTPFQQGINMKVAQKIENAFSSKIYYRNFMLI
jgi:hypothetical protein